MGAGGRQPAPLTLVVLAAGVGSRFGGLKPLVPVGPHGATLVDYTLHAATVAGFERAVLVVRASTEARFRDTIGARWSPRLRLAWVHQEVDRPGAGSAPGDRVKPWGTAHAVLGARSEVHGPFAVANADDLYGVGALRALAARLAGPPVGAAGTDGVRGEGAADEGDSAPRGGPPTFWLVGYRLRDTLSEHGSVSRGVCRVDRNGRLEEIVEHTAVERRGGTIVSLPESTELEGDEIVSMNLWGFGPAIFPLLEREMDRFLAEHGDDAAAELHLSACVDRFIEAEAARVRAVETDERWLGLTWGEDLDSLEARIRDRVSAGELPERPWA